MHHYTLFLVLALSSALTVFAQETVYVASDGGIFGTGSRLDPYGSIEVALDNVSAGDTIFVRGGTYTAPNSIRIDKSGDENAYLFIWAYPGETAVFDFTGAPRGFDIRGSYLHLKGLVAEKAEDNGIYVKQASYNIIEQAIARLNGDSGIQVEDGSAYNLLLNVDSYSNYDAGNNGENADGFAIKFGVGPGNVLHGCRAWGNSDDGYDFWSRDDSTHNGVTVENSWAFRNGLNVWDAPGFQGDSNGFKLGHGPGAHLLIGNAAWGHLAHGFDVNGNTSGVTLYNNTSILNGGTNFYFDHDQNVQQAQAILRNNLSFGDVRMDQSIVDDISNSWNAGLPNISAADFISINDTGTDGPRQEDGSLPDLDFLRLAAGSALIDTGIDLGLPYTGPGPDFGAFESDVESTSINNPPKSPIQPELSRIYPNPFNTTTRIIFEVHTTGPARLEIYDVLGRRVARLFDRVTTAGQYEATWNPASNRLPGGIYFARIEAAGAAKVQRMVFIK
ncbi:MAG: T9SS type A sorting domain-containing protein [Rhodothermales bacterium]